jgi:peptide deformylase
MTDFENCKIAHIPAPVLAEPSKPIEKIDDSIIKLVDKMADLMVEKKGVGFAAPQAGVPLRIFIISLDGKKENIKVFINPDLVCEGKTTTGDEGCLSVPGIFTKVRRYKKCSVTATGLDGKQFTDEAEGFYARILQHEFDHINGTTIADKMGTVAKLAHRKKLQELIHEQENKSL